MKSKVKLLLLALFAVQQVSAEIISGNCGASVDNVTWSLNTETKTLTISGSGAMVDYDTQKLPAGITDYRTYKSNIKNVVFAPNSTVTYIGDYAFYNCDQLVSITIPSTVTEFGFASFRYCKNLSSISIPSGVTKIANSTFYGCKSLTSVYLPSSVTVIGDYAFYDCTSLNNITFNKITDITFGIGATQYLPATGTIHYPYGEDYQNSKLWNETSETFKKWTWSPIPERLIIYTTTDGNRLNLDSYEGFGANMVKDTTYIEGNGQRCIIFDGNVTAIPQNAFLGQGRLTSITLPSSVTSIGSWAFQWNNNLASINIPANVTSIGFSAFNGCSSLASVTIPSGVTSIAGYTFYHCNSLASISMPTGVTSIGEHALDSCISLSSTGIPATVTNIGEYAFYKCSSLASINIPSGVTSIPECTFFECSSLASIDISYGVTSFGTNAFNGCSSLTSITIPESVTDLGFSTFNSCTSLASITIPSNVTVIPGYTFYNCSSLASIDIPSGVKQIYEHVFDGCSSLASIDIPSGVNFIYTGAFKDCSSLASITLPAGVTSIYDNTFDGCSDLTSVTFLGDVTSIGVEAFARCSSLPSITIPSGVTSISERTFLGCGSLASITLPSDLLSIGSWAFQWCDNLSSITIPASVNSIGFSVFNGCSSLEYINIPSGVTTIPGYTFYNCSSLEYITLPSSVNTVGEGVFENCSSLASITLPAGVTRIYDETFAGCEDLTSVTFLGKVTGIGKKAFAGCYSLPSFSFPSSVTSIGDSAFYDCDYLYDISIYNVKGTTLGNDVFGGDTPDEGTVNYLCGEKYNETGNESSWWTNTSKKLQGWTWERILDPNRVIEYTYDTDDSGYKLSLSYSAYSTNNIKWTDFGANKVEDIREGYKGYIVFDGNVTKVPQCAFKGNEHLTSIILSPTIKTIDGYALANCSKLESITLPRDLQDNRPIATTAFETYSNQGQSKYGPIKEIRATSLNQAPYLEDDVFTSVNHDFCKLYVPMGMEDSYSSRNGWKSFFNTSKTPIYGYTELSISPDVRWGTCILTFDCTLPEGVKAYKCSEINNEGNLVLTDETSEIKARTPYILYAENGCLPTELSKSWDKVYSDNSYKAGNLTGVIRQHAVTSDSESLRFVLQNHSDEGVKFYKIDNGVNHTVKPGRCYLTITKNSTAYYRYVMLDKTSHTAQRTGLGFVFDLTKVPDVQEEQQADSTVYDLQGRPVSVMEPGHIYIVNGQKILVTE